LVLEARAGGEYTISGRVLERRSHEPFENVAVEVRGVATVYTSATGSFRIPNVQGGLHVMVAHIPEWGDFRLSFMCTGDTSIDVVCWPTAPVDIKGVLAHYTLDGNGADDGPDGHHGENLGAVPTTDRYGLDGHAMHFDGRSAIEVPHIERFNQLPLSMSCWIKVDAACDPIAMYIGKYYHPSGDGWCAFLEYGHAVGGYFTQKFGNSSRAQAMFTKDEKWHHIVVTMDTTVTSLYVDGVRISYVIGYASTLKQSSTTAPFRIGSLISSMGTRGLVGSIDDVYIIDHTLTEVEIALLRGE
jgi:hypothetical protein